MDNNTLKAPVMLCSSDVLRIFKHIFFTYITYLAKYILHLMSMVPCIIVKII